MSDSNLRFVKNPKSVSRLYIRRGFTSDIAHIRRGGGPEGSPLWDWEPAHRAPCERTAVRALARSRFPHVLSGGEAAARGHLVGPRAATSVLRAAIGKDPDVTARPAEPVQVALPGPAEGADVDEAGSFADRAGAPVGRRTHHAELRGWKYRPRMPQTKIAIFRYSVKHGRWRIT